MILPGRIKDLGHLLMRNSGIHHVYHQIVCVVLQSIHICITRVAVPTRVWESK
jgi:hypothetical protein